MGSVQLPPLLREGLAGWWDASRPDSMDVSSGVVTAWRTVPPSPPIVLVATTGAALIHTLDGLAIQCDPRLSGTKLTAIAPSGFPNTGESMTLAWLGGTQGAGLKVSFGEMVSGHLHCVDTRSDVVANEGWGGNFSSGLGTSSAFQGIVFTWLTGGADSTSVDLGTRSTGGTLVRGNASVNRICIGGIFGYDNPAAGAVAVTKEMIVWNRVLSRQERTMLHEYRRRKWGGTFP